MSPELARAWALKDACYEAWTREPAAARSAAEELAVLAAAVPDQPLVQALAAWTGGIADLAAGSLASALDALTRAGAAFAAAGDGRREAETQVPCLIALALLGRHDEALALGERAQASFLAAGDEAAAGRVELNLASMLMQQDRYAEAAQLYRASALRFARAGDRQHSVMADAGLATALAWQFDFDEAERIHDRAARRAVAHGLRALRPVIDVSRGRLALHRGRHTQALAYLGAALSAIEPTAQRQAQAEAERSLADAYAALHLWPEAQALYDRAARTATEIGTPIERAWTLVQRADVLAAQGATAAAQADLDVAHLLFTTHGNAVGTARVALQAAALATGSGDPATAQAQADRAAAAFAEAGVPGWQGEALVLGAEARLAQGEREAAERGFRAALRVAEGLPEIEAACFTGLGRCAATPVDARSFFERAVDSIERQRAALAGDEFRIAYGSARRTAHEALLELALREGDARGVFEAVEGSRAQALRQGLRDRAARRDADPPERERWRFLHAQWRRALDGGQVQRAAELQQRIRAAEHEWLEAERRARASAGAAAAHAPGDAADPARVPSLARLQSMLAHDAALVEFVEVGRELVTVIVRHDAVTLQRLDGRELDRQVQGLRQQLDTRRHGAAVLRRHDAQLATLARSHLLRLYRRLWEPLEAALRGAEAVVVVPHRSLHYVPFAALYDGSAHLVERIAVSLAPSAATWITAGAREGAAGAARVLALGCGGAGLPGVDDELDAVGAAFGVGARVLRGHDADQAHLRAGLAEAEVLHLACHGEFRADSPYFSALHLADGPLTLHDASALPLQGLRLVTLSACETGLSRQSPGDELLGLVRGFMLAGAPAVLASQWTVDDASTAELMGDFYRRLRAGEGAAEALRRAQCQTLRHRPDPWNWGAFSLHGRR